MPVIVLKIRLKLSTFSQKRVHFSMFQPILDLETTLNISQEKNQTTARLLPLVQYQEMKNAYDCLIEIDQKFITFTQKESIFQLFDPYLTLR